MSEFLSRVVQFEPARITVNAIEQRAPARLLALGFAAILIFRSAGRVNLIGAASLVALVAAVLLALWALAPRREIVFDSDARKIEVRTRSPLRGPEEIVFDFDAIDASARFGRPRSVARRCALRGSLIPSSALRPGGDSR